MPDVTITIGGRAFDVSCQEGEEHFLQSAAAMLDSEAQGLVNQLTHLTESRMLLMAGLMLADKTAGLEDTIKAAEQQIEDLENRLSDAQAQAASATAAAGPALEALGVTADHFERLAEAIEAKAAG